MRIHKSYLITITSATLLFMAVMGAGNILAKQSGSPVLFDFSDKHPAHDFYTDLNGEWQFFEGELLTPGQAKERLNRGMGKTVSIPGSFADQTGDINSFGTYRTRIKIPEEYIGETLAIHIPFQYSAYTLYTDKERIAKNGVVGEDAASHTAESAPKTGYFIAQSDEIALTMQVSSFDHIRGGFENTIYLGEAAVVAQKFNTNMIGTLFINGVVFIVGLFMALFAWHRKKKSVFCVFGIFAMLISVRALFASPFYYTFLFTDMSWLWGTRLEYISTEAASMFYVIWLWKWHEADFSRKIMYGLVTAHLALIVTTLFTQPVFFQALFFKAFYLTIPIFLYVIYIIIKRFRNNNTISKVNLVSMLIIFLAFFNDFTTGNYQGLGLMLPGVAIAVIIHVFLMSKMFADTTKETERQNNQLLALNASNEALAVELQKEIKQKDNFLASTSHELRNPLHGIINITQSIIYNRSEQLDKRTRDDLKLQLTIGRHMSRTLGDLLDITRLKEKQIHLQRETVQVQAVSTVVVDMLKVLIENKNVRMDVRIPSIFPGVAADKNRMIQILFNLLHNAVKYTHEGTITISADTREGMAHIHIADTGTGMSEETLRTIFEPYKQDDASMKEIEGGLGLGLNICKQLVEMHGGTIQAVSVLGEGSVFTFTLPLADASFESKIAATSPPAPIDEMPFTKMPAIMPGVVEALVRHTSLSYRPRILVVDDDPVNLKVLTNILSEEQYKIATVTSGKEALKQLEKENWDLVISDVLMPVMSGYELARSIRQRFSISELPILLLTARNNQEDIYTGFTAGANDYVVKPLDALELNVRVHALTSLQASINERLWMEAAWLQAQIRPHFMLNTLNTIVSLSETDTARMADLIENLSIYLQHSFYLKNLDKVIPLSYELELLESYLYIEKERFGDRLHINWEIEDIDGIMIPPLSIQTLVENAVNHGVLQQVSGGTVTIRIRKTDDDAEISVIDDGIGMDKEKLKQIFTIQPDQEKGIGLINTEQRLKRLYGKGLHIDSTPGAGTAITFTVPLHSYIS